MPAGGGAESSQTPRGAEEAVERAVAEFARAWEEGRAPPLEDYLARQPAALRAELRTALEAFLLAAEGLRELSRARPAAAPADPERIGPYRILEALGRGGMGTVYLVEQESPVRRKAALKLVNPGMDSRNVLRRFEAERQALAIMEHDGIAKVFDAGTDERGRPYFVMEYVPGVPIDRYCREKGLGVTERVHLFLDVLAAVHHAHQKGILHRDLKPSNILVAEIDGRPRPKIIDFGLARSLEGGLDRRTLLTLPGAFVGTPEYVAPEQVAGPSAAVDTRADVYSLGVILYELLTAVLPLPVEDLRGKGFSAWERAILEEDCDPPSRRVLAARPHARALAARLRGDLDWITMKALDKDRERRYQSVEAFAEDLRRHLRSEPVTAGPPSGLYRLRKLVRKHRRLVASLAAVVLALAGGLAAALSEYRKARAALVLAAEKARETKRTLDYLQLYLKTLSRRYSESQRDRHAVLSPGSGWREDFESYPLGAFPPENSLWVIGTDNRDARIVDSGDEDHGKVLELRGRRGEFESTDISHPLSPTNLAYVPEFTLHLFFRSVPIEPAEIGFQVRLTDTPHWRESRGGQEIAHLSSGFTLRTTSLPPQSDDPFSRFLPGIWNSLFYHYRRLDPDHIEVELFLNDRLLLERTVRPACPNGVEDRLRWLSVSSGDRWIQVDAIEVHVPDPARPWVREPKTGRWYGRTPRPMTWGDARAWAEAAGGRLAVLRDRWQSDWLRTTFGSFAFWIGLERRRSRWRWLDGRELTPEKSPAWLPFTPLRGQPSGAAADFAELVPNRAPNATWGWSPAVHATLPALVEFEPENVPVRAAALPWREGCRTNPAGDLAAIAPPVRGRTLRLRLPAPARGLPPLLALGPRRAAAQAPPLPPDLRLAAGCELVPRPEKLLPPTSTQSDVFEWRIPLPAERYAMGQRFFAQALVPAARGGAYETSRSLLLRAGTPPLGGDLVWLRSIGGGPLPPGAPRSPRYAKVLALPDGKILLAGRFRSAAAFGRKFPRFEKQTILSAPGGGAEAFLACFDREGRFLWAFSFGGPGYQTCTDLTLGPGGALYVTGRFRAGFQFESQGRRVSLPSRGGLDLFVARLDPEPPRDGSPWQHRPRLTWLRGFGGPEDESEPALAGSARLLFLGGGFRRQLTDASGESLASVGGLDLFVARLDGRGRRLWWFRGGGPADDRVRDLALSKDGRLFACGEFRETAGFPDRGRSPLIRHASLKTKDSKHRFLEVSYEDPFIGSWSPDGRLLWLRQPTTPGPASALCLAPAPDGGVFAGGVLKWDTGFGDTKRPVVVTSTGWQDGFVARYSKTGRCGWALGVNSRFAGEACFDLAAAPGGVYICGRFTTRLMIRRTQGTNPNRDGPLKLVVQTSGGTDAFLAMISETGLPKWLRGVGDTGNADARGREKPDWATAVSVLPNGDPVIAGYASGPALFGKGEPSQAVALLAGTFLAAFKRK